MSAGTLVSIEEYLGSSYDPDRDFVDGEVLERNVGKRDHSYAQGEIVAWFKFRRVALRLEAFPEQRLRVSAGRVRIPDVVVIELPIPDEDVFTLPPYICIEVMSPDDTIHGMLERIEDYRGLGVSNIWIIDPWNRRGWRVTEDGWVEAKGLDPTLETVDGRVAMRLNEVLLPS